MVPLSAQNGATPNGVAAAATAAAAAAAAINHATNGLPPNSHLGLPSFAFTFSPYGHKWSGLPQFSDLYSCMKCEKMFSTHMALRYIPDGHIMAKNHMPVNCATKPLVMKLV
ncbi:hypothetical protein EVAR_72031_1 [Eumeta japonica]|uniref:C2H2-type domain-containing protein n=1 Tax=Eumeta variegata TaxID=151549 RepID=A0A4C1SPR8_EUMVA|nr:hypothetical protein EVAR_72031_1 [Eumeta japonica]